MTRFRILVPVAALLTALAGPAARCVASASEDLAAAQQREAEARAALDSATESLTGVLEELDKIKAKLTHNYRVLEDEKRRRDTKGEEETRAKLEKLRATRDRLWAERERAVAIVALREAELETVQALVRVHELQSAENPNSAQIQQWQKKHEKALSKTRRLERRLQELEVAPEES